MAQKPQRKKEAKVNTEIEKLEKRRADINRKIQRLKNAESKKKRQEDTSRKILIGAMLLNQIKNGKYSEESMLKALDQFLTRDRDRALFNLPPASKEI